jgi:very-short-patch-repair endonuclease
MASGLRALGVRTWAEEHVFHPARKWRLDFAWPELRIAAEVEGGVFSRGRHVRPAGFIDDCEKYNAAVLLGWSVLRFPVLRKGWADDAARQVHELIHSRSVMA